MKKKVLAFMLALFAIASVGCSNTPTTDVVDVPMTTAPIQTEDPGEKLSLSLTAFDGKGMVSAASTYSLGARGNGTAVTEGVLRFGQSGVMPWQGVVYVAAGETFSAAVTGQGTVLLAGDNADALNDALSWTDIVMVQLGIGHIVGLKRDGSVVAAGENASGQCDVAAWSDVVYIAAAGNHTLGLKSDGSVVSTGDNAKGQRGVDEWVVQSIATCANYTLGIASDGSVLATSGAPDVSGFAKVSAIAAGNNIAAGILADGGKVVCAPANAEAAAIADAKSIAAGADHVVVLKQDGSVVAFGNNDCFQCDVSLWTLYSEGDYVPVPRTYDQKVKDAKAVNKDVTGWITLAGTNIDFPLMKATSDFHYNDYSWENKKSAIGSAYMYYNDEVQGRFLSFTAHNNRKRAGTPDSMFHELHHIQEKTNGQTHCQFAECGAELGDDILPLTELAGRTWRLNVLGTEGIWEVFAYYEVKSDKNQATQKDNMWWTNTVKDEAAVRAWIDKQIEKSEADLGVEVKVTDKLLTVLTCATEYADASNGGRLYFVLHRVG